jgi:hypothetical protein
MPAFFAFIRALGQLVIYAPALLKLWFQIKKSWSDYKKAEAEASHKAAIDRLNKAETIEEIKDAARALAGNP